jgi:hypothetical protein
MANQQWGWRLKSWTYGPFDTRDEAIADAMYRAGNRGSGWEYVLGEVEWYNPAEYVTDDVDEILDRMRKRLKAGARDACGNGSGFSVPLGDHYGAQADLDCRLREWALTWVTSTTWRLVNTTVLPLDE